MYRTERLGLIYTLLCIKWTADKNTLQSSGNSTLLRGDLNGKEMEKKGEYMYTYN